MLNEDSSIQIRVQFSAKHKTKTNREFISNFKIDSRTLKSYILSFKKRVLTRLEENDNNTEKTTRELNIHQKNLQRWNNKKDVIFKAVQNKRVGLLLYILSKEFLPKTKNFPGTA